MTGTLSGQISNHFTPGRDYESMNSKAKSGKQLYPGKYGMVIQIGSIRCELVLKNISDYEEVRRLYSEFITEGSSDITIELEVTDKINPDDFKEVLYNTVYTHEGGRFWTTSQVVSGQYDLSSRHISITAERTLGNTDFEYNHLNRLITMAYYSGCKIKYNGTTPPAFLLHACGIVRHGKAILFAGPSETGKTTIARLCGDRHGQIINDEMVLVSRPGSDGKGMTAQGVPIIGGISRRQNITAPVNCVCLLKQSSKTCVNHPSKAEVYLSLIRQVINPAYIGQRGGREVYSLMADFSSELVENIPIYELEFALDEAALWSTIEELEDTFGKDGQK